MLKGFLDEWKLVIGFISAFVIIAMLGCVIIWLSLGAGLIENKPDAVPWLVMWVTFVALLLALVGGSISFHQIQPSPQIRVLIQTIVTNPTWGADIELRLFNPGNAIALTYTIVFSLPHQSFLLPPAPDLWTVPDKPFFGEARSDKLADSMGVR